MFVFFHVYKYDYACRNNNTLWYKKGSIIHYGLLLSTKNNNGYYILEYTKNKQTDLYPLHNYYKIKIDYKNKIEYIKASGYKWIKELNGNKPLSSSSSSNDNLTVLDAKKIMIKEMKNRIDILSNHCSQFRAWTSFLRTS